MAAPLRRVMICSPETAGWNDARRDRWPDLGYHHEPRAGEAAAQHVTLRQALEESGAEVVDLPSSGNLGLDAVFSHDPSFMTDRGAILLNMGKGSRRTEADRHGEMYRSLEIPILGRIEAPGTMEAGDLVWVDEATVLAGRGYRTNAEGIRQLAALLEPIGAEVIEAPLPHGQGPEECLHLMSLMSVLDEKVILVDLEWLAVPTVELLRERGFHLLEIDTAERDGLACNVVSLGNGRLIAFQGNPVTQERMQEHGFQVLAIPGGEIGVNGSGGPTCLTRPILRA